MPTLNDMLKNMPTHKNFYLRGVINSLLPEFMDPFDSEINEGNISGEALEALRFAVSKIHPDMQDGEIRSINYEQMMEVFGDTSIFERNYDIATMGDELRNSLGQFGVTKEDGQYVIFDTYDFEPRGGFEAFKEVIKETSNTGEVYPMARFLGGIFMPEGPDGAPAEGALRVRIKIPNEAQVVDVDFDNDIEPEAPTFVFEGPMTNKRKTLWDSFTSMLVTPAEAFIGGAAESGTREALEAELAMTPLEDTKTQDELKNKLKLFPEQLPESSPFRGPRGPAGFSRGVSTAIKQKASEITGVFTDKM